MQRMCSILCYVWLLHVFATSACVMHSEANLQLGGPVNKFLQRIWTVLFLAKTSQQQLYAVSGLQESS